MFITVRISVDKIGKNIIMVSYDTIIIFLPILSTLILTVINILYFHDGKIKNKSERTFEKKYVRICLVWCTIGDSNPGPTD